MNATAYLRIPAMELRRGDVIQFRGHTLDKVSRVDEIEPGIFRVHWDRASGGYTDFSPNDGRISIFRDE